MAISNTTPSANFGDYGDHLYRTKQFMYPNDLLSVDPSKNEYGNQYMLIYVNITEDSTFKRADEKLEAIPNIASKIDQKLLSGQKTLIKNITGSLGALGALAGGAGGSILGGGLAGLGGATAGAILSTGLGLSLFGKSAEVGEFTKPKKRLSTAIALHIPNNIAIQYGVNYGETDSALSELAIKGMDVGADALKNLVTNPGNAGKEIAGKFGGSGLLGGIQSQALGALGDSGRVVGKLAGVATNPKKEQIFEGVPFRTFGYTYDFYPRSEEEAENVKRIIDELKYHMHPNFKDGAAGFLFQYPAEFDIYFMHKGIENKYIHKHRSAVLETMNVNYAPNGQFSTFANGCPTSFQVSLNFKEVAIITKEALEDMGEVQQKGKTLTPRNFGGQSDTF